MSAAPALGAPRFPSVIDASMRSTFSACPRSFYWQYVRRLRLKSTGIHLLAGGAFASGLERTRRAYHIEKLSESRSIYLGVCQIVSYWMHEAPKIEGRVEEFPDHNKSLNRVCGALLDYFCEYPLPTDFLKPLVIGDMVFLETSATMSLDVAHPETGEEILYAGRSDLVAEYEGGLYIDDEKTATQLGDTWLRKWDLRGQFFGYVGLHRAYGIDAAGVITRGISFLKNSYGHAQVPVHISDWQVETYFRQVKRDTKRMIAAWLEGGMEAWDQSFDDSCTAYGGCPYARLCLKLDPEPWLTIDYEEHTWNPLMRVARIPTSAEARETSDG